MSIALPQRDGSERTERPWLDLYPDDVPGTLQYPDRPIWWLLERAAIKCPRRIAVHYYDQRLDYSELWSKARRAAATFVRHGVRPDDRVGLLLPNTPEYLIAAYGIWIAGGVVVSINPLSAPREVSDIILATDCRLVVTLDMLKPLLAGPATPGQILQTTIRDRIPAWKRPSYSFIRWRRSCRSRIKDSVIGSFANEVDSSPPLEDPNVRTADDPAYILPTGGTTGAAKAVVLSHGNLIANAWQLMHWTGQSFGRDSLLAIVPFFHCFGLSSCLTTGVASATTMILYHQFTTGVVRKLIERYRPTCFPAVPMMLGELNEEFQRRPSADKQLIRYCVSGGAALPSDVAEEFARHTGALVVEGYGLSEASPVTHVGAMDGTARSGTIGMPLPDTDARIVDQNTGESQLAQGDVGELIIRGPQVMTGYYQDTVATRQALRDGWLYTGDLARQNDDGTFQIVDRKKDLIITSGANVYPAEIEQVLRFFPGVEDVAVVGVPDARRGEIVKAVIKLKQGTKFNRRGFDAFLKANLAKYKRPRITEFVKNDLPRNFLGKVIRRELR